MLIHMMYIQSLPNIPGITSLRKSLLYTSIVGKVAYCFENAYCLSTVENIAIPSKVQNSCQRNLYS